MRVLVTGGTGFIGSHLTGRLAAAGHQVTVLDDGSSRRCNPLVAGVDYHQASILDAEALRKAMDGCDTVFHLAARPSVPESIEHPIETTQVNAAGTLQVLEAARSLDVRKVVFASTCALYGDEPRLPSRETDPLRPRSPYAAAKQASEAYCEAYLAAYGLATTALRFFNVYGPGQDPAGAYAAAIPAFIQGALDGTGVILHGDGKQTRDFVFVDDVVDALLAAERTGAPGVFNVGSGAQTSLLDVIAAIEATTRTTVQITHGPGRAGDVRHSVAEVSRAASELGFEAKTSLTAGILATVEATAR